MTKAEDGLGKAVCTWYDGLGRVTKVTDPLSRNAYSYYDDLGRVTKAENPLAETSTFAYDPAGRQTLATDANSKSMTTYCDAGGLVTKTVDAASRQVVFAYDDGGRRTGLTDANTHTTAFAYDKIGRLTRLAYPISDAEGYFFDAAGRMTAKTTPNNDTIAYAYSPLGLLTLKTYPDVSTVAYSFDAGGRRTRVVDANTDNSYSYDDRGKITLVHDAKYSPAKEIAYLYDRTGIRTLMDRPSGDDITYFYDQRGAMTLIKEGAANRAVYSLDDAGGLTKTRLGNGSYANYLYNGAGDLTLLANRESDATVISAFAYGADDTGNRTKMSISGTAYTSADIAYAYDDAYQLTREVRTGGNAYSQYFWYDGNGNRTKSSLDGTSTTYLHNEGDQLTSETTGGTTTTYLYDANGALTKSDDGTTVKAYTYDYDGYQVAFDTTGTDNDATYTCDADKRRIKKTLTSATMKYLLDGADVIADYDGSDTVLAIYLTPRLDNNLSVTRSGSTYYYMKDGLGSIRNLIDSSEATQNVYDYYAFGKKLGNCVENVSNRPAYTAREWDSESAQYYYRARHYPGDGAFAQRDPLRNNTRSASYSYARANPLRYTDPTGLSATLVLSNVPWKQVKGALKPGRYGEEPAGYCDVYKRLAYSQSMWQVEMMWPVGTPPRIRWVRPGGGPQTEHRGPELVAAPPPEDVEGVTCTPAEKGRAWTQVGWYPQQMVSVTSEDTPVTGTLHFKPWLSEGFSVGVTVDRGYFVKYRRLRVITHSYSCLCTVNVHGLKDMSGDDGSGATVGLPTIPMGDLAKLEYDGWVESLVQDVGSDRMLVSGEISESGSAKLTDSQQEKVDRSKFLNNRQLLPFTEP